VSREIKEILHKEVRDLRGIHSLVTRDHRVVKDHKVEKVSKDRVVLLVQKVSKAR